MSKLCWVLLLSSLVLLFAGCSEEQANLGDDLLLTGQQSQTGFWAQYPENWETTEVAAHPAMFAKTTE